MPVYEYSPQSGDCRQCGGLFTCIQRIADEKLAACPTCGQACERRISAVALGGKYSMTQSKIEQSGFTQYKKSGDGVYERTAGKGGPEHLFRK